MKKLTTIILILMSFILLTCNDKITGNNNGNTNNDNNTNNGNNINNWNNNNNNNNNDNTGGNTPTEPTVYKYTDFVGTNYYIYKTSSSETEQQFRISIASIAKTNGRLRFDCDYKQGIKVTKIPCVSYDLIFDVYNATTTQSTFDFYYGMSATKPDKTAKLRTIDFKNKTISYEEEVYDKDNNKITKEILTFPYYSKDEKNN